MLSTAIFLLLYSITGTIYVDAGSPRIVIVGAGAAGIATASKLLENGFEDVLILEAENRIGGRINTTEFDEYVVDLGAQWIHGEKGNVAYELAAPLNLTDHSEPFRDIMYTTTGESLDTEIMNNITQFYIELDSMNLEHECNRSLGECYETRLKQHFALFPELNDTIQEQLLWHFGLLQTSMDPADSWYDIAIEDYQYMTYEGDIAINWKERGYSTILDILMKKFPNPEEELPVLNKTILKAEVTKVDYSSEDGTVKITTLDGNNYVADHVIMTPSLGVLKAEYEILFSPQLPESKIESIKTIGFGNACKIILAFNDTWFNERGFKNWGFSLLWNEEERKELDKNPYTQWMPYTVGMYVVEHKPLLLYLWISGKGARLMDDITDEEVYDQTMGMLDSFLGADYNK
ncbi:uncharacterized protein LOC143145744 isoform X2 [Ptiloglossa arizonensis]|uniref:uncharacterized protein LOC143145744 isoform X2 n=1 Tax=Ptiloglossa arizonensis TaxID=3350558 RepID=UPI003F9F5DE7